MTALLLDGVTYTYPDAEAPSLRAITLAVEAGGGFVDRHGLKHALLRRGLKSGSRNFADLRGSTRIGARTGKLLFSGALERGAFTCRE